jgi:hypothetical protein
VYSPEIKSKPKIEQMFELQRLGIVLAKEQQKLKKSRRYANAHIFLAKEVERSEITESSEHFRYSSHRFTGRVARIGYREWSMRVVEAFWLRDIEQELDDGFRSSYTFEWTDKGVTKAMKNIWASKPEEEYVRYVAEKPADALERIEHWVGFWGGVAAIEMVSQADCTRLIGEIEAFSQVSREEINVGIGIK